MCIWAPSTTKENLLTILILSERLVNQVLGPYQLLASNAKFGVPELIMTLLQHLLFTGVNTFVWVLLLLLSRDETVTVEYHGGMEASSDKGQLSSNR